MTQVRILIVEDDPSVASTLEKVLISFGYLVTGVASSGEDAVSLTKTSHPDLILMDIGLKGHMDGITAAKRILSMTDTPVIYLSAYSEEELLNRAKTTLPYGYLTKPVDERELYATITMAMIRHERDKKIKASEYHYREMFWDALQPVQSVDTLVRADPNVRTHDTRFTDWMAS